MTTYAKTARPISAAIAWATNTAIFVEIPSKAGPPYVARYKRTVDGLTAALNILIENADVHSANVAQVIPSSLAKPKKGVPLIGTAETRQAAADIVKKLFK